MVLFYLSLNILLNLLIIILSDSLPTRRVKVIKEALLYGWSNGEIWLDIDLFDGRSENMC